VKTAYGRGMVNAGMVNGTAQPLFPALFGEFLRVSCPIPRFQNPFKYICGFEINGKTVHLPGPALPRSLELWRNINALSSA
jgi:hypothetical protein